jgi:DNA repair protein RadC
MGIPVSSQNDSQPPETEKKVDIPELSHEGHRSRLLERFLLSGISSLHQHEIIELILTFATPRRDTKPIAKTLLAKYKTVTAIVNTPVNELEAVDGVTHRAAGFFLIIKELISYCLKEKYEHQSIITHRKDVEEYLRFCFGMRRDEYVAGLYLDNANHILQTELLAEGTVNQCTIYPRTVVEKALRCGAASMILAHNHPGGGHNPSDADWLITDRLFAVGKLLDIPLLDHVIISQQKVVSLRELPRWPR